MYQKHLEKIVVGAAMALAASALLPVVKATLRGTGGADRGEGMDILEKVKGGFQTIREEVEDIIAEAQFERLAQKIEREIKKERM